MIKQANNPADRLSADAGRAECDRVLVVFGDQLTDRQPAFDAVETGSDVVLMVEVREEATHVPSHKQRTALFFAAMRHFALELMDKGHRVRYVRLDDPNNTHTFTGEVGRALKMYGASGVHATHPGEHRVMKMVRSWETELGASVTIHDDAHFYTTPDEFAAWAGGRKQLVMEYFYREQRRRFDVLMTKDRKPVGGEWNFDKQNREVFGRAPRPPKRYEPRPDAVTREVFELVERETPDAPGSLGSFHWPVTRKEARAALRRFIDERLPRFGTFQDAMWTGEPWLYHSAISSSVNLKLLDPRECVAAAVEAYENGDAPINSVEGFVRQLLGWREFIRGVYWAEGPGYRSRNGLRQRGSLPEFYWDADTDMHCMSESLGQVVEHGYGHHIQRLMITGNFALIAGVHPGAVTDWYLGMYVDAVDWVTAPNTLGMAMHADHGVVGTKPYAASGKYVSRMSNYCEHCRYDVKKRTGEDACPFNTFYWDFLIRHRERFRGNNRMAMILKNVDRMGDETRAEITREGKRLRKQFGITAS